MTEHIQPLGIRDPRSVGRYRLAGRLGAGGMGVVYLAYDGQTPVAVKVVRDELADDQHFRARFAREVDVLRRIGGLCTVQVLDADAAAEAPYLVTEYVPGPNLSTYVADQGPLSEPQLAALAAGLAEALQAIHAAGVVHRDLKPSNVLLSPDGPKVIDFGIAQVADATALTQSSTSLGSPGYIAPEQVRGLANTAAADVFTWGATVAFAATGRPPFGQGAADAVMFRVLQQPADVEGWDSPTLRPLVEAALAKEPTARPTPMQLSQALLDPNATTVLLVPDATRLLIDRTWFLPTGSTRVLPGPPAVVLPAKAPRRRRLVAAYGTAAIVGAIVGGISLVVAPPAAGRSVASAQPSDAGSASPSNGSSLAAVASAATGEPTAVFPGPEVLAAAGRATPCIGGVDAVRGELERRDLDDDGLPETLARYSCPETAENGNATSPGAWVFFAGTTGVPRETQRVSDVDGLELDGDEVLAFRYSASSPTVPRCCPDLVTTIRYSWGAAGLSELSRATDLAPDGGG